MMKRQYNTPKIAVEGIMTASVIALSGISTDGKSVVSGGGDAGGIISADAKFGCWADDFGKYNWTDDEEDY